MRSDVAIGPEGSGARPEAGAGAPAAKGPEEPAKRRGARRPKPGDEGKFCIHCGAKIPGIARFCIKCGRPQ
jgi:hypothetical protein